MILQENGFRSGGSLNPEVVAAVDRKLEEERTNGHRSEAYVKVKSEELKVENGQEQTEQGQVMEQTPAAPVEKPKPNPYPFLPPGYTSRTD